MELDYIVYQAAAAGIESAKNQIHAAGYTCLSQAKLNFVA